MVSVFPPETGPVESEAPCMESVCAGVAASLFVTACVVVAVGVGVAVVVDVGVGVGVGEGVDVQKLFTTEVPPRVTAAVSAMS